MEQSNSYQCYSPGVILQLNLKVSSNSHSVIAIHVYWSHANFDNALIPIETGLHASLPFVGMSQNIWQILTCDVNFYAIELFSQMPYAKTAQHIMLEFKQCHIKYIITKQMLMLMHYNKGQHRLFEGSLQVIKVGEFFYY